MAVVVVVVVVTDTVSFVVAPRVHESAQPGRHHKPVQRRSISRSLVSTNDSGPGGDSSPTIHLQLATDGICVYICVQNDTDSSPYSSS